jgi:hypothetical protein
MIVAHTSLNVLVLALRNREGHAALERGVPV